MVKVKDSNEIRTYSCPNCYLCSAPGKLIYRSLNDRLFGVAGEWNLKQCTNSECGLVWLDPMPLEEDIGKAYQTYYTHDDDYVQKKSLIWLLLRAIYRVVTTIPAHILGIKAEESQLSMMYLNKVKPCRLLEIGFGSGEFLSYMQRSGWDVEGVDFDAKAVENVRAKYGIRVHLGNLESVGYPDNSFDAITMNHVIEHIPNPVALLQECYRILKPGGHLVALTPNITSWGHKKFGENWLPLDPPRHLHLFSQTTLQECAQKAGFHKIKTWTTSVRAIGSFHGSFDIRDSGYFAFFQLQIKPNFIKALIFHYYEYLLIKHNPDIGEEVVIFATKNHF